MPHIRKDPVTKQSVIISSDRIRRPSDYFNLKENENVSNSELVCPFCKGHEDKTPDASIIIPDKNSQWAVRIVPNKYPIISETDINELPNATSLFDAMGAKGFHDVIIENPNHYFNFYNASKGDLLNIFRAVITRLKELSKESHMQYSLYFKNFGREAGASLYHSHSQMITTPFIPIQMLDEINGALEYYNEKSRCVYCDIIKEEKNINERVICENGEFVAVSPFASRMPYQIYILPKRHSASIIDSSNLDEDFADIVKNIFGRINKLLGEVGFNYVLHTLSPMLKRKYSDSNHWFLDIMPKTSKLAGYELGSGVYINSITPEDATKDLKNAV